MNDGALAVAAWLGEHAEMIIALSALIVAVQQGRATRRHERLSVRPYIVFDREVRLELGILEFRLENKGPGTAYIDDVKIFFDNTLQTNSIDVWHKVGASLALPLTAGGGTRFGKGDALSPHSSAVLASFSSAEPLVQHRDKVHAALDRVRVLIRYRSAFDEVFGADSGLAGS